MNISNESGNFAINYQYITPTGSVVCFAGQSVPPGWLLCDGSELSKTVYSSLYAVIGNAYGNASNASHFVLPNLQQRIPLGKSNVTSLGNTGGSSSVSLTTDHLPSHTHTGTTATSGAHTHTATDSGHAHLYSDAYFAENMGGSQNIYGTSAGTDGDNDLIFRANPTTNAGYANISVSSNGDHSHTFTTNSTGTGSSFNILNPYLVLNYIIKN